MGKPRSPANWFLKTPRAKIVDYRCNAAYPFVMKNLLVGLLAPMLALSSCTVIIRTNTITLDATSTTVRYFPSKAVKKVRFENFSLNDANYSVTLLPTSSTLGDGYSLESSGNLSTDAKFSSSLSDDGVLLLKTEKVCQLTGGTFALTVYGTLNSLSIDGSIPCSLSTLATTLDISVDGAATLKTTTPLTLDSLTCTINGAASFTFSGTSQQAAYSINGSGTIDAKNLHCEKVTATIDGAGFMSVYATSSLTATIDGTGTIDYYGNPSVIDKKVTGLGSVNPK
jgi:hypothetical protein